MVIYRNFREEDSEYMQGLLDEDIAYWCGFPYPETLKETENYVKLLSSKPYWYAIEKDGNIVGCISIHDGIRGKELGYWMGKEYRNQGIMQNAIKHMINKAFNELGLKELNCGWFEGNEASKHIQLKAGFEEIDVIKVPYATGIEHLTILRKES